MNVLIVTELYMPDFRGGGETVSYKLAQGLKNSGINVKVITTGNPSIKEHEGIETIRLSMHRYLMNFAYKKIEKYVKWADIIQTTNYNACYPAYLAAKKYKKPIVCTVHGLYGKKWIQMRGPIFGWLSQLIEKKQLIHNFDRFVFHSNYSLEEGIKIGILKNKATVIHPGIEHKNFHPLPKENFVLFMGRLSKQKGIYKLIEAAKELPDITFKLVGTGEEEEKLKKISPKNVEFHNLNFKSGKPFFDLYSKASIFCLPSVAESFGIVIVEAMASGCAIVSTIPLNYKGFTIKQDKKELVSSIKYLYKHPTEAKKMGNENIKLSKDYNWDKFTDSYIQLYKKLIKN